MGKVKTASPIIIKADKILCARGYITFKVGYVDFQ